MGPFLDQQHTQSNKNYNVSNLSDEMPIQLHIQLNYFVLIIICLLCSFSVF